MPTQLVVLGGPDKGRVFALTVGVAFSIGRGAQSHTHLVDLAVSRIHCEVRLDGVKAVVTDANSVSGTFVNGQRITSQELRAGDVIQIGETRLRFDHEVADQSTIMPAAKAPPQGNVPTKAVVAPENPTKSRAAPAVPPTPAAASPAKEVVFANKRGARVLPKPLKDLHDLVGKSVGSYQLLNVLGTGQVGVVFQAKDTKDQKILALKVLRPDFAKDAKAMQRFVRGMMSVRTLSHPNLIELYNAGITGPHCWIAMEFIEGNSVSEIIQQSTDSKQRDWRLALGVAVCVSRALGVMHAQGMIHRSVIPQNIMVRKSDQVAKLGDAMLAKALEGTAAQEVTASGEFVGNVYYMAPERTKRGAEVDGRADLYSLGVTLYALLTGQLPFEGGSMPDVIAKIRQAVPENPRKRHPDIPDAFETIVLKMLEKRPEDRYQSASELLTALEPVAKAQVQKAK